MFLFKIRKKRRKNSVKSQRDYLLHRELARKLISERVDFFSKKYNFFYQRIAIKNTKTRWGSCSIKKNLNFNYRILFLEKELQDYIIVHELCHLNEMNHSKKFWLEIEKILPDYKKLLIRLNKIKSN